MAYDWITKGGRRAPEFPSTLVIFRSMEECEAAAKAEPKAEPKAKGERKPRVTLQDRIRERLDRGETVYWSDFPENTEKTFVGAIRGLKNPKYAGPLWPLNIVKTPAGGYRLA